MQLCLLRLTKGALHARRFVVKKEFSHDARVRVSEDWDGNHAAVSRCDVSLRILRKPQQRSLQQRRILWLDQLLRGKGSCSRHLEKHHEVGGQPCSCRRSTPGSHGG